MFCVGQAWSRPLEVTVGRFSHETTRATHGESGPQGQSDRVCRDRGQRRRVHYAKYKSTQTQIYFASLLSHVKFDALCRVVCLSVTLCASGFLVQREGGSGKKNMFSYIKFCWWVFDSGICCDVSLTKEHVSNRHDQNVHGYANTNTSKTHDDNCGMPRHFNRSLLSQPQNSANRPTNGSWFT